MALFYISVQLEQAASHAEESLLIRREDTIAVFGGSATVCCEDNIRLGLLISVSLSDLPLDGTIRYQDIWDRCDDYISAYFWVVVTS